MIVACKGIDLGTHRLSGTEAMIRARTRIVAADRSGEDNERRKRADRTGEGDVDTTFKHGSTSRTTPSAMKHT